MEVDALVQEEFLLVGIGCVLVRQPEAAHPVIVLNEVCKQNRLVRGVSVFHVAPGVLKSLVDVDGGADDAWIVCLAANLFFPLCKPFLGHLDSLINKEALAELAVVRHLPVEASLVEPVVSLLIGHLADVEELVQGAGQGSQ